MILLFAGLSATGKSTIARMLGERFDIPVVGEREILHRLAVSHGFQRTRYWLGAVGIQQVLDEALLETVRTVRNQMNTNGIIIDGSYDRRLAHGLQREFPRERVVVIAVTLNDKTREDRMISRMRVSPGEALGDMRLIDGFKIAAGVEEMTREANVTIENGGLPREATEALITKLEREFHQFCIEGDNFPLGAERH